MTTAPFTAVRTECTPINFNYTVKFDRTITSPKEWQEEIDTIRLTKAGDHVTVHVNTEGGDVSTLNEVLHAIEKSEAYFHCVLAGNAYSAGGPIMLACDSVEVGKFAGMMLHCMQTGYGGGTDALKTYAEHSAKASEKLLRECYEGFCTTEELEQASLGKEFWFDADEIVRRLQVRNEYREAKSLGAITEDDINGTVEAIVADLIDTANSLNISGTELLELVLDNFPDSEGALEEIDDVVSTYAFSLGNGYGDYLNINHEGFIDFGEGLYSSFSKVYEDSDEWFRTYADILGIKYAHNISRGKLITRMDNKVKELVASLDK